MGICWFTVNQGNHALVENWGKFTHEAEPGCHYYNPCTEDYKTIDMRIRCLEVDCKTQTSDDVTVSIECNIQYQVIDPANSYYKLSNPIMQIKAYVYDVVRSQVPKKTLNEIYVIKEELSAAIKQQLQQTMKDYGYQIVATPVTDIRPNANVLHALNEQQTQRALKVAMIEKAESDKILMVTMAKADAERIRINAEARADAKHQEGLGLSRQRQAIIDGLTESVRHFQKGVDVDPETVMDLILITQYFDMMEQIGSKPGTNTIFIPHNQGVRDLASQIRQGQMEAQAAKRPTKDKKQIANAA